MKRKILIKFLYLIALLTIAAWEGEKESQLIDSDPVAHKSTILQAFIQD
ncbi:MAG: hypothetical protein RIM99_10590 [Cyclobacteriaceae bacterium]